MGKVFKVTATVAIEVKTLVRAENEEAAKKAVQDREISICVHGTGDEESTGSWTYNDAPSLVDFNDMEAEEYEEELDAECWENEDEESWN